VRTCARKYISDIQEAKEVLAQEVHRYNFYQVHSTTKEIPALRFEKAIMEKRSLFRPFAVPIPFSSPKDIFCIQYLRVSNGYRKVSFAGHEFQVPGVNPMMMLRYIVFLILKKTSLNCGFGMIINCCSPPFFL
jgi:hypothetical protein